MTRGTTRLRVTMIASEYPPHVYGGLGRHVESITRALGKHAAIELVVPAKRRYDAPPPGVTLLKVPVPGGLSHGEYWDEFGRVAGAMISAAPLAPDIVHAHDWMTARASVESSRAFGVPLVFNVHLPQPSEPGLPREADAIAHADAVIVNSVSVLEELAARGADAKRINVIPNGVDLGVFKPAADWPADDGSILFVGRLVPQKGADVLIRALAALLPRCPDARLVIVGEGESRLLLKRLVRSLGLGPAVTFAGWATGQALVAAFQRAAVVVVPSRYEPFGIVALEGMACGRPVVATSAGGLPEFVDEGVGALVPVDDHLALARVLARLLNDPAAREAAGRNGTARAAAFSWDMIADRTIEVYRRVLATGSRQ